jgi:hypothetical protein
MAQPVPKSSGGKTVTGAAAAGTLLRKGDVISGNGNDGWTVLRDHIATGNYPKGYSDDNVHYSVGPSAGGPDGPGTDGRISGGASGTPSF